MPEHDGPADTAGGAFLTLSGAAHTRPTMHVGGAAVRLYVENGLLRLDIDTQGTRPAVALDIDGGEVPVPAEAVPWRQPRLASALTDPTANGEETANRRAFLEHDNGYPRLRVCGASAAVLMGDGELRVFLSTENADRSRLFIPSGGEAPALVTVGGRVAWARGDGLPATEWNLGRGVKLADTSRDGTGPWARWEAAGPRIVLTADSAGRVSLIAAGPVEDPRALAAAADYARLYRAAVPAPPRPTSLETGRAAQPYVRHCAFLALSAAVRILPALDDLDVRDKVTSFIDDYERARRAGVVTTGAYQMPDLARAQDAAWWPPAMRPSMVPGRPAAAARDPRPGHGLA